MSSLLFISGIGPTETLVILAVALVVFGGRLPEVAKSLGRSLNELRRGMRDLSSEIDREVYSPIREEIPKISPPKAPTMSTLMGEEEDRSEYDTCESEYVKKEAMGSSDGPQDDSSPPESPLEEDKDTRDQSDPKS